VCLGGATWDEDQPKQMSQSPLNSSKRDYVLPWGSSLVPGMKPSKPTDLPSTPDPKPSVQKPLVSSLDQLKWVTIPDLIPLLELARVAGQKPFRLIADLMEHNCFANVKASIDFATAAKVLRKYGIIAKRADGQ
jgi:hypothetical protein